MSDETSELPKAETPRLAERAVQVAGLRIATAMNDIPRFLMARVPLVVLFAANHPWQDYRLILERFAPERRVFALDWPGFGASEKPSPSDFAYSVQSYAEILAGWMDSLGIARAVFVGNSVGAGAAIQYAAAHPQRALGLLLVAPAGFTPPGIVRWTTARLLGTPGILRAVVGPFTSLYLGPTTDATKDVMDQQRERRAAPDYSASIDAYAALWRSFNRPGADLSAVAREVTAPAMVVRGALDPIITEADARRAAEALGANTGKRALEVVLPHAGHLPFLQEPERFLKAVEGLLATAEVNAATAN
jgi:pimeloyl-ACP methyl ester carboxylesterase